MNQKLKEDSIKKVLQILRIPYDAGTVLGQAISNLYDDAYELGIYDARFIKKPEPLEREFLAAPVSMI